MTVKNDPAWVNVRCSPDQRKRMDQIVAGLEGRFPVVTRAAILRRALDLGIAELERNPKALMSA